MSVLAFFKMPRFEKKYLFSDRLLVSIFKKWQNDINILTASEEQAAINIISEQHVDLVVCGLTLPDLPQQDEFYGALINMSSSGGLCHLKAKGNQPLPNIEIDSQVQLRCLLPGLKEEQKINTLARNIQKNSREMRIGIKFIDLHDYVKEVIERYLYSVETITN